MKRYNFNVPTTTQDPFIAYKLMAGPTTDTEVARQNTLENRALKNPIRKYTSKEFIELKKIFSKRNTYKQQ